MSYLFRSLSTMGLKGTLTGDIAGLTELISLYVILLSQFLSTALNICNVFFLIIMSQFLFVQRFIIQPRPHWNYLSGYRETAKTEHIVRIHHCNYHRCRSFKPYVQLYKLISFFLQESYWMQLFW